MYTIKRRLSLPEYARAEIHDPVMVVSNDRRIGLYPSLDEALDRRHRSRHPVGSVYVRIRDGEPLARLMKRRTDEQ